MKRLDNKQFNKQLDGIIEKAIRKGIEIGKDMERNSSPVTQFSTSDEYAAITKLFGRVIGDDVEINTWELEPYETEYVIMSVGVENKLRAALRQIVGVK